VCVCVCPRALCDVTAVLVNYSDCSVTHNTSLLMLSQVWNRKGTHNIRIQLETRKDVTEI